MRDVTKEIIKDFKVMKLGYDFMGYEVKRKESLSFHHLIVPRRLCKEKGLGEGYHYWNGVILVQETSHDYLHLIENKEYDMFCYLTSEMLDMKIKEKLDIYNLRKIKDVLETFEKKYKYDTTKKGKRLIKREYIQDRIIL